MGLPVQRMDDVGVMQGGRCGAVGEREVIASEPAVMVASVELTVQRGVGEVDVERPWETPSLAAGGRSASPTILCTGVAT